MPFFHPAIFWGGLAAVAVPILIHLLNRRRFRIRDWAAMKFLLDSLRKNRRRLRIEELILLAIRCLVVALLATAVARFTGCSAMKVLPGAPAASQTSVFVLDDSASMGQTYGAGTLFSAAANDLAARMETMPSTDKVAILLTSGAKAREFFFPTNFVTDSKSLAARLRSLKPSDQRTYLSDALAAAGEVLGDVADQKRLYVLSDFRRADLIPRDQADVLRKQYAELKVRGVQVAAMDYGVEPRNNLTVAGIELGDRFAVARQAARIALGVRNNGPTRVENVDVRVLARLKAGREFRDVELPTQTIESIDAGATRRIEFPVTANEAGSAVVSVQLPSDDLAADNKAHLVLHVRSVVKVLVVDGRPDLSDPAESESFYFVRAIDPRGNASYGNKPDVIAAEGLAGVNFDDYDLVALLNVPDFPLQPVTGDNPDPYPQLTALQDYVRRGGGLAIFTGDRLNLDFYNKRLFAEGAGLAPLAIGPRKGQPGKSEQFYRLDPKSLAADPILRVFRGESAVMTDLIRVLAFSTTEEAAVAPTTRAKPPRVLARFTDPQNSPAIVARQYGKGTVVMFCTTASAAWTDWPTDPVGTYVAVMNDLCWSVARAQSQAAALKVGEPVVQELPADYRDAKVLLKTPDYPAADLVALEPVMENGQRLVRYNRADQAGIYSLTFAQPDGGATETLMARNVDADEGDLAPGHREDLAAALGGSDFRYELRVGSSAAQEAQAGTQKEYWTWALVAMLALLALETVLGLRFGHYARSKKA